MSTVRWLLKKRGKWHAWIAGSPATVCGKVTVATLREQPASKIQTAWPDEGACTSCVSALSKRGVRSSAITPDTGDWLRHVRFCITSSMGKSRGAVSRVPDDVLSMFAARMAEIGPVTSPEALRVFTQVRVLFLKPVFRQQRQLSGAVDQLTHLPKGFRQAVALLEPGKKSLLHVATTLESWRAITKADVSYTASLEAVISTILRIPNPPVYISRLYSRGLTAFGLVFNPKTLERAFKSDPALYGTLRGTNEYVRSVTPKLNIVTD